MKFKSDIEVQAGLKDSSGAAGTSGQVLSSNGTTVSWINSGGGFANDVQNTVKAGVAINKGQAVYVTGADGTNIIVGLASNTSEATSSKTLGLLNATVAVNGFADVIQIGKLAGLDTSTAVIGDPVWLGANGNLVYGLANKPYAPLHLVYIGVVTRVNANNGEIFINVQNGFELKELHDVSAQTPANNNGLFYNTTSGLWEAKSISAAGGVQGTGASGQVAYWNGTSSITGESNLFWDSTNDRLGIGTASPDSRLMVSQNTTADLQIHINNSTTGAGTSRLKLSNNSDTEARGFQIINNASNGVVNLLNYKNTDLALWTNNTERMRISAGGNVLIGTTTDSGFKLDVNGTQAFRGTASCDTPPLGAELLTTGSSDASWTGTSFATGYTHVAGSITTLTSTLTAVISTFYQITYTITGRTAGSFSIDFGGVTRSGLTATGKYGPLATSTGSLVITPTTDFNGTIVLSIKTIGTSAATTSFFTSTGVLSNEIRVSNINSNTFIGKGSGRRNTTGDSNAFFGNQSGISNTTGSTNAFFGINAGYTNTLGDSNSFFGTYSGQSNTTGSNNTAVGRSSLFANTTGGNNTAVGQGSLTINTTGTSNTAVGVGALLANTTGNNNAAIGSNSLSANTTGGSNVAIGGNSLISSGSGSSNVSIGINSGFSLNSGSGNTILGTTAARYAGAGTTAMTAVSNSIYLGALTRGLNATGSTNEIVIGYDVVGLGSNTASIGNSSTTATAIYGDLLLGSQTDNGTDKLQVTGSANITGQLKLGSTITNGTFTYTLPGATGTLALVGGAGVGTVTSVAALTLGTTGTDLSSTVANSTTTPVITLNVPTASATNRGALSAADWTTFNSKQNALTNPVTGTGTTNYVPKFTGTSTVGSSTIYDNVSGVGINTIAPNYTTTGRGVIDINGTSQSMLALSVAGVGKGFLFHTGTDLLVSNEGNGAIKLNTNGSQKVVIEAGGNVGIGTNAPINGGGAARWLTIDGTTNYSGGLVASINGNAKAYFYSQEGYAIVQGSTGEGVKLMPNGTNGLSIFSNGNTFIGSTPTDAGYKLDVNGTLKVGGSSGAVTTPTAITMDGTYRTGALSFDSLKFYLYKSPTETYGFGLGNLGEVTYWAGTASTGVHAFYTSQTERMRITSAGNVGINVNPIGDRFQVAGSIAKITAGGYDTVFDNLIKYGTSGDLNSGNSNANRWIGLDATVTAGSAISNVLRVRVYGGSTGNAAPVNVADFRGDSSTLFYGNVTAVGFFNSSDIRLKEIVDYDYSISDIKPISYLWKDSRDNKKHVGYSAQEVQKVMPDAVNEDADGMLSVNYIEVLVAKIAELENRIKQLEK